MAVPTAIAGNTVSVARASRQSSTSSTIAEPISVSVFCRSVVGPSVTMLFMASMSFVRREMTTPAGVRSKKPRSSLCTCPNTATRMSASTRSPTQLVR
jgi:hypothetical protein